jgi:hypothetical protein
MKKLLITTFVIFLLPFNALSDPFKLESYDEKQENTIDFAVLQKLALKCMYDKEWLDLDVDIQSGVSNRDRGFGQYQDTFAGLVVRVPLYSGKELDRERNRTLDRKKEIIDDATKIMESVEQIINGRKMLGIYKILEKRSQRRVMSGVIGLEEQVVILEKIGNTKKQLNIDVAEALGSRQLLLAKCKNGIDKTNVKNYLDRLEEMNIK